MKIFTCRICGEVYLGSEIPHSCPFCGVLNKYLRLAHAWEDENDIKLSEISRNNLEEAVKLEVSNAEFYKCISKTAKSQEIRLMFKGLFKVEREHADVFVKLLKLENPEIRNIECGGSDEEFLNDSLAREKRAVAFYAKAMNEAAEPRVREVFEAIMNVEKDHIQLDLEKLN